MYSHAGSWLHFKTVNGMIISTRLYMNEDFPNVSPHLKVEGKPAQLPKGLIDAIEKCNIFSGENKEDNQILVELRRGKLRVKGEGASGYYQEHKKMDYEGPAMSFYIDPKLLMKLTHEYSACEVAPSALKVDGGKFVYVTSLERADAE